MKYFGTDGIRLEDMSLLKSLAIKTSYALKRMNANKVVIGYDARPHGKKIVKILIKCLNILGIKTYFLGVVPTACASFSAQKTRADFAVMITASHNPSFVNGIKIFNAKGEKLTKAIERKIESWFNQLPNNFPEKILVDFAKENNIKKEKNHKLSNIEYLRVLALHSPSLKGKKVVLDCANGASKKIAKKVFLKTGAKVFCINRKSGKFINHNCGAVFPNMLKKAVLKHKADIGFAFDGDADRCVCVLSDGTSLSGDNVLVALARYYNFPKIVGTVYSNGGIEQALKQEDITFLRSDVGDQAVKKLMNKEKCSFGGERSGHFIFSEIMATGDGLLSALKIANIKNFEKLQNFKKMPSITFNIPAKNKVKLAKNLIGLNSKFKQLLDDKGRVMIRPSGTEPLVRVLIEHPKQQVIEKIENLINVEAEN